MQKVTSKHVQDFLAQVKQKRANKFSQAEFALQISHPEVFISYKAAHTWALHELSTHPQRYSGDNHAWHVHVHGDPAGYECSISQYWWSADHCGALRPTGALAIVQSVLELQVGY
jgi:hypothetical protein